MNSNKVRILLLTQTNADNRVDNILQKSFETTFQIIVTCSLPQAIQLCLEGRVDVLLVDSRKFKQVVESKNYLKTKPTAYTECGNKMTIKPLEHSVLKLLDECAVDYLLRYTISEELVVFAIRQYQKTKPNNLSQLTIYVIKETVIPNFIGQSPAIQNLADQVMRIASTDRPVLITGSSGSGKELIAHALHELNIEAKGQFIDVNCAAIPEALFESHLFGHDRGAFTGADRQREGYLAKADEGTLFLDEIAELPLTMQTKLLRVLESGTYRRVGSNQQQYFTGRILAATHIDLRQRIEDKLFREDLFYRLNVFNLAIPALNHRSSDIPLLADYFIRQQSREFSFTDEAMTWLIGEQWPGNVRQLRNVIERVAILCDEEQVTLESLLQCMGESCHRSQNEYLIEITREILQLDVNNKIDLVQRMLVNQALEQCSGNKSAAARILGVHRKVVERMHQSGEAYKLDFIS